MLHVAEYFLKDLELCVFKKSRDLEFFVDDVAE
jgi:hypothetical protein